MQYAATAKKQKDSNSGFEQQMQHIQCIGGP